MNTNIIVLADCLNGNEDLKQWDKDKDGTFKIKPDVLLNLYGSAAVLYIYNFFFLYLSEYTQKHKTATQFDTESEIKVLSNARNGSK